MGIFDYFQQGGFMMYPLALTSIISFAIIIERLLALKNEKLIDPNFILDIQKKLEENQLQAAIEASSNNPTLIARITKHSLEEHRDLGKTPEDCFEECCGRDLEILKNNIAVLTTVARVTPLMGLLGTVIGMIGAFASLSQAGVGKEQMAGEIQVALITTATGMIVAIPTFIGEMYFRSRVRKSMAQFDIIINSILKSIHIGSKIKTEESAKPETVNSTSTETENTAITQSDSTSTNESTPAGVSA